MTEDQRGATDLFVGMGVDRRPWIDVDGLQARFLQDSSVLHPDRHHEADEATRVHAGQRYSDLNTAYQVLREARTRLLHLIELESGAKPRDIQKIPPGTMDLFVEVGQLCRDVDAFLAERGQVTSPMLKVRLFRDGIDWVEKLKTLQGKVVAREAELGAELKEMNAVWESAPPIGTPERLAALPLGRLEEIYRVLSYANRWSGQIQERLIQLASG